MPAGLVRPLPGRPNTALFDTATSSLVVLDSSADTATITVMTSADTRPVALPGPAGALSAGEPGEVLASTRGGYLRIEVATGQVHPVALEGHQNTDFTAVARRNDGRLVLGSATGTVYTLNSDNTVGAEVSGFVSVDAIVTQGNTAVILDRAQSSVTTLDGAGERTEQALRAGEGAATIAADPAGRVLVADTRDNELLVFSVDPLIMRQRYPVPDGPYGLVGGNDLVWVSQTGANMVIGYDLASGIPVEKVRYPTVQQPDSLAFDATADTLYVVSATGGGVQVIDGTGGSP